MRKPTLLIRTAITVLEGLPLPRKLRNEWSPDWIQQYPFPNRLRTTSNADLSKSPLLRLSMT